MEGRGGERKRKKRKRGRKGNPEWNFIHCVVVTMQEDEKGWRGGRKRKAGW